MKNNIFYKLIAVLCVFCVLFGNVFAANIYEPGITGEETGKKGELNYKEVIFLSGEPVLLSGTAAITESKTSTGTKTTIVYELSNTQKDAKLDRKIIYINTDTKSKYGNQTTHVITIDPKVKEVIQIGSDTYTLTDYKLNKSGLTEDKAIIKYNRYDWDGRKTYTRSSGGEVIVDVTANTHSYDNYWSSTETSLINNTITFRYKTDAAAAAYKEAVGTVEYAISNSKVKNMEYMLNEPAPISFKGGYLVKENQENIVSYVYDIPSMKDWTDDGNRSKGRSSFKLTTIPTQTRLFSPQINDVASSYWAAEDIKAIAALDIISVADTNYFRPLSYISRAEFTRAIVKAANIQEKSNSKPYELLFDDVEKNHPYFTFINIAVSSGIINGTGNQRFSPDQYITKAQAATIIVRAMGLEETSLESSTKTTFADDYKIPGWAKKSVNIGRKMGIISGNNDNELEPDKLLTRAEASEMINNFIKYLQYDIRKEYREKLIDYGR